MVRIREILDHDFDAITYGESHIDNLLQLIDEVEVWKPLLTDVEFGFFIALRFFVDVFSSDMKQIDNALATLTAIQQECDVAGDDSNDADNQRIVNANTIKELSIAKKSADIYINDLEDKFQSTRKEKDIEREIEALTNTYNEVFAKIMAVQNRRTNLQSKSVKAQRDYDQTLQKKSKLIEAWSNLKSFIHMKFHQFFVL